MTKTKKNNLPLVIKIRRLEQEISDIEDAKVLSRDKKDIEIKDGMLDRRRKALIYLINTYPPPNLSWREICKMFKFRYNYLKNESYL